MSAEVISPTAFGNVVDGLPPAEYWIRPPRSFLDPDNKLPTPTDSRGLIVVDELIDVVLSCISPEYKWPPELSLHHTYWPFADYAAFDDLKVMRSTALPFRELPCNKLRVPRVFENVLHRATAPPPIPAPRVMRSSIEAWWAARLFFGNVRGAARAARLARQRLQCSADEMYGLTLTPEQEQAGEEIMNRSFVRNLKGVAMHLGTLQSIPVEYWPFTPDLTALDAAGRIGHALLQGWTPRIRPILAADIALRRPLINSDSVPA